MNFQRQEKLAPTIFVAAILHALIIVGGFAFIVEWQKMQFRAAVQEAQQKLLDRTPPAR